MSDTTNPIIIEKQDNAFIARVQIKLLDEKDLKLLGQLVDQASQDAVAALVVIDLSAVQMLPSLGLGALVQMASKCRARQQKLKLAAASPQLRQVFSITKLDRVLELTPTVEAALEG